MKHDAGAKFDLIWYDDDLLEFRISVASATFAGETTVYAGYQEAEELARGLAGFPRSMDDRREFVFQASEHSNRVAMRLLPDAVHFDVIDAEHSGQSAHVVFRVEAAMIDRFVPEFSTIVRNRAGSAFLAAQPG